MVQETLTEEQMKDFDYSSLTPLFDIIPEIENTKDFLFHQEGSYYPCWNPILDKFHNLVYELRIIIRFDWTTWEDAPKILKYLDFDYDSVDKLTLIKLITTMVRAERFNEGFLPECFSNGTALKILKALQRKIV